MTMPDALQYGALGLLGVVLLGVGSMARWFVRAHMHEQQRLRLSVDGVADQVAALREVIARRFPGDEITPIDNPRNSPRGGTRARSPQAPLVSDFAPPDTVDSLAPPVGARRRGE